MAKLVPLIHRENTILVDSNSSPGAWGDNYTVVVYPVAAVSTTTGSSATPTVVAGHSFVIGDRVLIDPGGDNTLTIPITAVTSLSFTTGSTAYTYAIGDVLVNLGPDGSVGAAPSFDGSPMKVFSAGGVSTISNSIVTANSLGEYEYWHKGSGAFTELIRDSTGTVVGVINGFDGDGTLHAQDYGAVGDGTTDDGKRIQAMLTTFETGFVPSHGNQMTFFPGDYHIDTAIDTQAEAVRWVGLGGTGYHTDAEAAVTIQADTAIEMITLDGVNQSSGGWGGHTIENIRFEDTSGAGTVTGALRCDRTKFMHLENVAFVNFWGGYGIHANADSGKFCDYWTLVNPRFSDCLQAIKVTESAVDWTIIGGRFQGSIPAGTFRANQKAIAQAGSTGSIARWNVYGTGFNDFSTALDLDRPRGMVFTSCSFEQGSTNDLTGTAIDIAGTSGSENWGDYNIFQNCQIEGFATGITIGANCEGNQFKSCWMRNCTTPWTNNGSDSNVLNNSPNANDGSTGVNTERKYGMYYGYEDVDGTGARAGINATAETTSGGVKLLKRVPILEHPDNRAFVVKDNTMQAADTVGGLAFGTTSATTSAIGQGWSGDPDNPTMQGTDASMWYFSTNNITAYTWSSQTAGDTPGLSGADALDIRGGGSRDPDDARPDRSHTFSHTGTPSVAGGNLFLTNAGGTTITNFSNGIVGQIIHIVAVGAVTINHNANIFLDGSAAWTMAANDTISLAQFTTDVWKEISRTDIGAATV